MNFEQLQDLGWKPYFQQQLNSAMLAEKRERERKLGKMYRKSQFAHDLKRKPE